MDFPVHIPFVEQLGFELVSVGDGEAEVAVALGGQHLNSFKVAHGGVTMTLLDVAMAHAARSVNRHRPHFGPGVVTIEMKTSFIPSAPAWAGCARSARCCRAPRRWPSARRACSARTARCAPMPPAPSST